MPVHSGLNALTLLQYIADALAIAAGVTAPPVAAPVHSGLPELTLLAIAADNLQLAS